jgi:hemerythrin-like domain-containing protein
VALHHPKETEYLFKRLRLRTGEYDAVLDELDRQHDIDHEMVNGLVSSVEKYCQGSLSASVLGAEVNQYARFIWDHMGQEENAILPAALKKLTESDWVELHTVFVSTQDPRFKAETDSDFKHLFSRIVNLVPQTGTEQ